MPRVSGGAAQLGADQAPLIIPQKKDGFRRRLLSAFARWRVFTIR